MQNITHVAGNVKITPAKKVNIAITPLIKIAVKLITTLYPIIFQKFFISILKLFQNDLNGFELFATTFPVKWEKKVNLQELIVIDKNDTIARPITAFKNVSAMNKKAIKMPKLIMKKGNE